MSNLMLVDLIDKIPSGYIILCTDIDNIKYKEVFIPNDVYNNICNLDNEADIVSYTVKSINKATEVNIERVPSKRNKFNLKIKFDDYNVTVPVGSFKTAKVFCFQIFLDIKVYDNNHNICNQRYVFLKNYNTKNKAMYFLKKTAYKFSKMYEKWLLFDDVIYEPLANTFELFHGDIIYERELSFKTKDNSGIAIYKFNIISIEKG